MLETIKRSVSVFICFLFFFTSSLAFADNPEYSLLNTEYVRLLGRGEVVNGVSRTFNWPNAGFEFEFSGTIVKVYVDRTTITSTDKEVNGSYFNVAVYDGDSLVRVERIKLDDGWNTIYSKKTDDPKTKKIMLVRSSEACRGTVMMSSLMCDSTPSATLPREKKIEFIGDSYTAGYGNSPKLSQRNIYCAQNTDNWNSYTGIVARNYNADNNVIAYQGKGVYANRTLNSLNETMFHQFDYAEIYVDAASMNMSTREEHIFYNYQPQVVTIWLGTNDEAVPVDINEFEIAYNKLLDKVRNRYPNAVILNMALESSMYLDTISKIVYSNERGEDNKYYMLVLDDFTSINLGHPDIAEDNRIAQQVIEKIDSIEGAWDVPIYNEESTENLSLRVDYNTGRVSAYGNINVKDDYISAVVMRPGTTLADIDKKNNIAFIGQATTNKAGEFWFSFPVKRLEGEYIFYLNSAFVDNIFESEFVIKNLVPSLRVTSNGKPVNTMSDVSETKELTASLSGFKVDQSDFEGTLVIVQYENGMVSMVDVKDASSDSQAFGTEVTKTILVNKETDGIKVFYLNMKNISPLIGEYSINS